MKNICEECAFQNICKHECKEKNLHDNYVSRDKIREVIKKYYDDYERQKRYRYTKDVDDEQIVLKDIEKELLKEE